MLYEKIKNIIYTTIMKKIKLNNLKNKTKLEDENIYFAYINFIED